MLPLTLSGTCLAVVEFGVLTGATAFVANVHCLSYTPWGDLLSFGVEVSLWMAVCLRHLHCPVRAVFSPLSGCFFSWSVASSVCGRPRVATADPAGGYWFPHISLLSLVPMAFQKRPQPTDFIDPLASKKPRISHFTQRAQPTLNGKLGASNEHETLLPAPGPTPSDTLSSSHLPPRLEPPRTHDPLADVSNDLGHSTQDYKHQEATPAPAPRLGLPLLTDFPQAEQPTGSSRWI